MNGEPRTELDRFLGHVDGASLHGRLFNERIQGRKTWGLYVDLIAQIRKTSAAEREQRISELWQRVGSRNLETAHIPKDQELDEVPALQGPPARVDQVPLARPQKR